MARAPGLAVILQPRLPVNATHPTVSKHDGYARELFSVQGERVTLEAQRGWQCSCTHNTEALQCTHIEQAQALRKIRGVRPDADTIELQFSAAQLQKLSQAQHPEQTFVPPTGSVAVPTPLRRHSPWATIAVAAAMSAVTSGLTYLATARAPAGATAERHSSQTLAASPTPRIAVPREDLVKVVNPFDTTEIFEFPPGTSHADARHAVAEFLLNRARARQAAAEVKLRSHRSAERERLEHAMRLAEAG